MPTTRAERAKAPIYSYPDQYSAAPGGQQDIDGKGATIPGRRLEEAHDSVFSQIDKLHSISSGKRYIRIVVSPMTVLLHLDESLSEVPDFRGKVSNARLLAALPDESML